MEITAQELSELLEGQYQKGWNEALEWERRENPGICGRREPGNIGKCGDLKPELRLPTSR